MLQVMLWGTAGAGSGGQGITSMLLNTLAEIYIFRFANPHEISDTGLGTRGVHWRRPCQLNTNSFRVRILQEYKAYIGFTVTKRDLLAGRQYKGKHWQADEKQPQQDDQKTAGSS